MEDDRILCPATASSLAAHATCGHMWPPQLAADSIHKITLLRTASDVTTCLATDHTLQLSDQFLEHRPALCYSA